MKVERKKEIHKLLQRILKMGYQMVDSETSFSNKKKLSMGRQNDFGFE